MASLKLQTDKKRTLYFSKYKYCARLKIQGANYTYYSTTYADFKYKMDLRIKRYFTEQVKTRLPWIEKLKNIDYVRIEKFINWRNNGNDKIISRIQGSRVSIFSDDLALLETLTDIDPDTTFSQVTLTKKDTILFKKEPKFKYRTFFKSKMMPDNFKDNVLSFVKQYENVASVNPALKTLFSDSNPYFFRYLHGSHYVDYNTESMLTVLHIYFEGMIGKTYSLEKES